jgi:hypothetical protein
MAVAVELQNQWEALLKLIQVREPKLYEHLKRGRIKDISKYNLVVYAQSADDLREIEVGLKVYQDSISEFVPMIFQTGRGIKTQLASESEWTEAAPTVAPGQAVPSAPANPGPAVPAAVFSASADQNELLKVLEASIRQKVEAEIRGALQAEAASPEAQELMAQKLRDQFLSDESNRRLAVRMALIAEGDNVLTQLVIAWQQAKQNGEGGAQWLEVKQRLLELLDASVQLMNS